jgi:multidrug efflux pump subunit AcrA (membrane-fusion protein)
MLVGQAAFKVGGFGAREFVGEVRRINPVTADGSRAITLYIAVANPNRALKGGMFAQGALTPVDRARPPVPQRAVHEKPARPVTTATRRSRTRQGRSEPGRWLCRSAREVVAGDRVIVTEIAARKSE